MSSACRVLSSVVLLLISAGISPAADDVRRPPCAASRRLIEAVSDVAAADIPIAAAQATACRLPRLPASLPKILPLLPGDHRSLIEECARGRMRVKRGETGFDLIAIVEDPSEQPAAEAAIRSFFDERAVDVAVGRGLSDEPYPISFDWVVVLDPTTGTLYSFILNCRD